MQSYQINELEQLTGVKAHTIRIWEKRYELITPYRTTTNRRYYDDSQVRKLLNVTTLLARGYKISKIASLTEADLNTHILDNGQKESHDHKKVTCINDLIKAMLAFDEAGFEKIYESAIKAYGIYDTMQQVIYPFLHKTGILWSGNKVIPVQEHFASSIIRRKLLVAIDKIPQPVSGKTFLLFLPPGEWHETGLLFADYIIRASGYNTIYLGQNVPFENAGKVAPEVDPAYMLLFFIAPRPAGYIETQLRNMSAANPDKKILVSGTPELFEGIKSLPGHVTYLPDVQGLLDILKS